MESLKNNYHIDNGVLYLSEHQLKSKDGLWIASEVAVRSMGVYTIMIPYGRHDIEGVLRLRDGVSYLANKGTELRINPMGANNAISIEKGRRTYATGVVIDNIDFVLEGESCVFLYTGTVSKLRVSECSFSCNGNSDYGILVGDPTGRGSIDTNIFDTQIKGSNGFGVYYASNGSKHTLDLCHIQQNECNLGGFAHRLSLRDCAIEISGGYNIDIVGGVSMSIENCSFEKGDISINGIERLIVDRVSRFSLSKFNLSDVEYASIKGNRLNGCKFDVYSLPNRMDLVGNYMTPNGFDVINESGRSNYISGNFTAGGASLPLIK